MTSRGQGLQTLQLRQSVDDLAGLGSIELERTRPVVGVRLVELSGVFSAGLLICAPIFRSRRSTGPGVFLLTMAWKSTLNPSAS